MQFGDRARNSLGWQVWIAPGKARLLSYLALGRSGDTYCLPRPKLWHVSLDPHCCLSGCDVRKCRELCRCIISDRRTGRPVKPPFYSFLAHRLPCQCSAFRNCNPQKKTPSPANNIPSPPAVPQPSIFSTVFASLLRLSTLRASLRAALRLRQEQGVGLDLAS